MYLLQYILIILLFFFLLMKDFDKDLLEKNVQKLFLDKYFKKYS